MKIIEYDTYLVREDGRIFDPTTKEQIDLIIKRPSFDIYVKIGYGKELVRDIVARSYFNFDFVFKELVKIEYIDFDNSNNHVCNIKITPKTRLKNNRFIFMNNKLQVCSKNSKGVVEKFTNIGVAYEYIIKND
jgi:hypothetical protein